MSQESLENFGAYKLAMELFDLVVADMNNIQEDVKTHRLIAQQIASADSICSNIEEGHGRETTKDYAQFLVRARGSARETRGRYVRMKHWLAADVVVDRTKRCDAVLGILSRTIFSLRKNSASLRPSPPAPPASPHSGPSSPVPPASPL